MLQVFKQNFPNFRTLIDSGAGSSYASAKLMNLLKLKPVDMQTKRVDTLMSMHVERLETYETVIESLSGDYKMNVDLIKVNKGELIMVDNPNYKTLLTNYSYLKVTIYLQRT